jgi:hypothetical protein
MLDRLPRVEDTEFSRLVFIYLENRHSDSQLQQLSLELTNDPVKRTIFIDVCLARQGLVSLLRERDQFGKLNPERFFQLGEEEASLSDLMTETMIVPAIKPGNDDGEIIQEYFSPTPVSHTVRAKPWWQHRGVQAAAILLPILGILAVWTPMNRLAGPTEAPLVRVLPDQPKTNNDASQPSQVPLTSPVVINPEKRPNADSSTTPALAEAPRPPTATVGITLDSKWDHTGRPFSQGTALAPGIHSLDEGIGQITLSGGAKVIVQAPATFEIKSGTLFDLAQGQLSAKVSHENGRLTVITPDLIAVDLGTEFGVKVSPEDKKTHLEVFVGQVRAQLGDDTHAASSTVIEANQSVAVKTGSSVIDADTPTPLEYVRFDELRGRAGDGGDSGLNRWKLFVDLLRQDPGLTAYYTFEPDASKADMLLNQSPATNGRYEGLFGIPDKADSSPIWSKGRWGKGALKFGDHGQTAVRIASDQDLIRSKNFSVAFWVKRSELQKPVHLLNQGFNGKRCFNVELLGGLGKTSALLQPNSLYFDFGRESTQSQLLGTIPQNSQWVFIAITIDADRTTRVYLDGQLSETNQLRVIEAPHTGDFYIGRTSPDSIKDSSLKDFFQGVMDELAIFHRALSEAEVRRMYEAGKP